MLMDHPPIVSTIMIFLNAEEFMEEAIESVFAQTYEHWELLLVDDGSSDRSTAIALQYAHKNPAKIRYLEHQEHQNLGTSASRNLGINDAQGEYIAFLDADDVWLPQTLEQQVAIMQAYPEAAMAYGRMQLWYSWTSKHSNSYQDRFFALGVPPNSLIEPPKLLINTLNYYYQEPGMGNAIIRATVLAKLGNFEEYFRGWGEDKVFYAKLQLNAPIFVSGECWLKYRQHSASLCHKIEGDKKLISVALQDFIQWLEGYLVRQGMNNTEVWKVLQDAKTRPRYRYRSSAFYHFWISGLKVFMVLGRRILPVSFRGWLWERIGSKLYG